MLFKLIFFSCNISYYS